MRRNIHQILSLYSNGIDPLVPAVRIHDNILSLVLLILVGLTDLVLVVVRD